MGTRAIRAAAAALLLCLSGCATSYGGSNGGGMFGGQKVTRLGPDRWEIIANSNGYSQSEYSRQTALYKAGLVARAMGMPYIEIYDFSITTNQYRAERAVLRMRLIADRRVPFHCTAVPPFRGNCRTLSADATILLYGPRINRTPAQGRAEVEALRAEFGDGASGESTPPPSPDPQ